MPVAKDRSPIGGTRGAVHMYFFPATLWIYQLKSGSDPGKLCGLGPVGFPREITWPSPAWRFPFTTSLDGVARRRTGLPLRPHFNPRAAMPEGKQSRSFPQQPGPSS
jgi:hypothetical protein